MKLLLGFSWIEKGGLFLNAAVVYGTLVFGTESVDGKQRKYFYVVSYSDELCLEMVIFVCTFSVDLKIVCYGWGRGGGGGGQRSEHAPRVVYETLKIWKLLNSLLYTNQNSCKCLREALTIQ